ncbi:unnamed protein product [Mycena citricolor]|uniref:Uncharacterized protein n=1 Tax=Mycena citricolor TaxID=2018698 RepID=A0AAD2JVR3_9AGAR|nr:unnamed protein product [Mycena citricolor]
MRLNCSWMLLRRFDAIREIVVLDPISHTVLDLPIFLKLQAGDLQPRSCFLDLRLVRLLLGPVHSVKAQLSEVELPFQLDTSQANVAETEPTHHRIWNPVPDNVEEPVSLHGLRNDRDQLVPIGRVLLQIDRENLGPVQIVRRRRRGIPRRDYVRGRRRHAGAVTSRDRKEESTRR